MIMSGNFTATTEKRSRTITRIIILTSFCSSFLGSAVNIVVPAMSADLAVSAGAIGWVITVYSLVAAFTVGANVTLPMAIFLSFIATLSACGTSGVAGGSLLLVPLGCSLFGIPNDIAMQIVGIGFILSVIQDSMETALNSSGDAIFTATAEFLEWKKKGKKLPL